MGVCFVYVVTDDAELAAELGVRARGRGQTCLVLPIDDAGLEGVLASFKTTHLVVDQRSSSLERVRGVVGERQIEIRGASDAVKILSIIEEIFATAEASTLAADDT